MTTLIGGLVILGAALLGGITGFGFALVSTPLLLILGLPLPIIVIINLCLATTTRIVVAYRLRRHIDLQRVFWLVLSSIPGILLGAWVLGRIEPRPIKIVAGVVVLIAVVLLIRSMNRPPPAPIPGATGLAGFLGGFMGVTTSLNGIPAVLLLTRDRVSPKRFQASLALFFILANTITLTVLATQGAPFEAALIPRGMIWLPIAIIGNMVGVHLGTWLPDLFFRRVALGVAFCAGLLAIITA
ncbi:sulfite exporter TauE/SafE family protein [Candidatus Oscillochloris fontis]|uniref:sulfite exporter TauE/SafE family protein n=1 Tax=Candidatus Oscillochloris fontis TaxID=2496868 RepID=UPI00101E1B81|nr:sulfite exporter TauE/SafE family protein [Candidatus Oscillochloris fontis]